MKKINIENDWYICKEYNQCLLYHGHHFPITCTAFYCPKMNKFWCGMCGEISSEYTTNVASIAFVAKNIKPIDSTPLFR